MLLFMKETQSWLKIFFSITCSISTIKNPSWRNLRLSLFCFLSAAEISFYRLDHFIDVNKRKEDKTEINLIVRIINRASSIEQNISSKDFGNYGR